MNDNMLCIYHQFSDFVGNGDWKQGRQSISCSALLLIISLLSVCAYPSAEPNPSELQLIMQHPQLKVTAWKLVLALTGLTSMLLSFKCCLVLALAGLRLTMHLLWTGHLTLTVPVAQICCRKCAILLADFWIQVCLPAHQQGDHWFLGVLHQF